jgi:hypothetical protein
MLPDVSDIHNLMQIIPPNYSCMSVNLGHALAVGRILTSKNDDTVVARL